MKFYLAIDHLNGLEGGEETVTEYHWDDDGGGTKGGITQTTFTEYLVDNGMPSRDVRTITKEERIGVIFCRYWMRTGMTMAPGLDFMAFQFGFVAGTTNAIRRLQPLLTTYEGRIDGLLGPKMYAALQAAAKDKMALRCLIMEYAMAQDNYYEACKKRDPHKPLAGWKNRTRRAVKISLADLAGD